MHLLQKFITRCTNTPFYIAAIEKEQAIRSFVPGAHVETHSLTTTELNGKFGRIQGRQGGRFEVIFDDIRYGGKSLKVSNLRIVTSLDVDMTSHARDSNSTLPLVHIDPLVHMAHVKRCHSSVSLYGHWLKASPSMAKKCVRNSAAAGQGRDKTPDQRP